MRYKDSIFFLTLSFFSLFFVKICPKKCFYAKIEFIFRYIPLSMRLHRHRWAFASRLVD